MSPSHSSLSEHDLQLYVPLFPVLPHLPSLLPPSRDDNQIPPNPRTGRLFGRLAIQRPLTVVEPNAIVEISSTEGYTHSPSINSGEDAFGSGREGKHRKAGFAAAHAEERSKCNPCKNTSLYRRKIYVTLTTHSKHGKLVATQSHKRKSSRDKEAYRKNTSQITKKVRSFSQFRAEEAVPRRTSRLSEAESEVLLEKQRNQIL